MKSDMRTIAANTGVSIATVSRALNGGKGVAPETRRRIAAEAEKLGRRLNKKTILFITVEGLLNSYYLMNCLRILWRTFEDEGYRCELVTPASLDVIEEYNISGAIAMMTVDGLERYWGQFFAVPLVCINSSSNLLDNVWSVLTDEYDGMKKLLTHLTRLGHRKILYLGPEINEKNYCTRARCHAFEELSGKMHLEYAPVIDIVWDNEEFPITAQKIIKSGTTAVIVGAETITPRLIWHLRNAGCRVPEDISVCGWEIPQARTSDIPITMVAQNLNVMAAAASSRLRKLMAGEKVSGNILVPCYFYPRMTTAAPPAGV